MEARGQKGDPRQRNGRGTTEAFGDAGHGRGHVVK